MQTILSPSVCRAFLGCQVEKTVDELNLTKKIISCHPSNLPLADHVGKDAGCGASQRIRNRNLVFSCLDPSHHAKAPDVIKIDGLEPEKLKSEKSTQYRLFS